MSETDREQESEIPNTDAEWREKLSDEEYHILRESGTEPRFSGEYVDRDDEGVYTCKGCDNVLFESETKYHSGCGWPSFYAAESDAVTETLDTSHGMRRTEIRCAECDSHLGHVFNDGPEPTGKRFCINSVALDFEPGSQ